MSASEAKKMAEEYLKEQARIIEQYGAAPKLRGDRYKEAVSETQKTFQTLRASSEKSK
jgi:hypothetical protein